MTKPAKHAFLLRLDQELWEAVQRLAAVEIRSLNGQVEVLLREALARRGALNARGRVTNEAD